LFRSIFFEVIFTLYLVPAGLYWAWHNKVPGMPLMRSCIRRKRGQSIPPPRPAYPWKLVLLAGILVNLYTYGLFALSKPSVTESFKSLLFKPEFDTPASLVLVLIITTAAAFYEEVVFRLALQNLAAGLLRKHGLSSSWAILLSAGVWTLGHTGMVVPVGLKELQIFGVGLVLGKVMDKAGLEGCIVVHLMLNLLALLYAPLVISL
jgi:membrane protease YdiL (CAAX protease family)